MEINQLLRDVQNPDARVRDPAVAELMKHEFDRFAEYLGALVGELSQDKNDLVVRAAAALQIKRMLTGQDEFSQRKKLGLWQGQLSQENRNFTKIALLTALASAPNYVSKQAAQCIEAIAKLELPERLWPELPSQLVQAFDQAHARDSKELAGPLEALGYYANAAATIGNEISASDINNILTKIIVGLQLEMPGEIQAAAMTALENTLEFARLNMENDNERAVIMSRVLAISTSSDSDARIKAFQCLGTVLSLYYTQLKPHMMEIYKRTFEAIRASANDEAAAKQALNFWDELSYEEGLRNGDSSLPEDERSLGFVNAVQDQLLQLVVEYCLLQQDDIPDDDEMTDDRLYGAAEHCLISLCACLGSQSIPYILSFVQGNINHPDWRRRQAAVFAFGAAIRDNETHNLTGFFPDIFISVLRRMLPLDPTQAVQAQQQGNLIGLSEPVVTVRETACWAVGGVCGAHRNALSQELLKDIILGLLQTLKDKPRVAHQAATAFHALAESYHNSDGPNIFVQGDGQLVHELSQALWTTAIRPDSSQWQLMTDCYEALIKIVEVSGEPTIPFIGNVILKHSLARLEGIRLGTVEDPTKFEEAVLCDVVHSILMKLDTQLYNLLENKDADGLPDKIMECMIGVLNRRGSNAHSNAFSVVGELTRVGEGKFKRYQAYVMPLIEAAMKSRDNAATCISATRCCSDVCGALGEELATLQLVEGIMSNVYENLRSEDLQKDVKPVTLSLMGDVAIAIGWKNFEPYFVIGMKTALSAADIVVDITDDEYSDYLNSLRESAIGAIELMVLDAGATEIGNFLANVCLLAQQISLEIADPRNYYMNKPQDTVPQDLKSMILSYSVSDEIVKSLLGLIGEVAAKIGSRFTSELRNKNPFGPLLRRGASSVDPSVVEAAQYAYSALGVSRTL